MNHTIKYLLYGANLWYLAEGMLGPLLAIFTEHIGGDILDVTWAWAIYLFASGFLTIYLGKVSDKLDKRKMMVVGYGLNALFTFGYLFVSAPYQLFIIQAGIGIAGALATPTWNALYSKYEDKRKDGYEWGLANGEANIVTGAAIILGGILLEYGSFALLFATMGIVQVIATIVQAQILRK